MSGVGNVLFPRSRNTSKLSTRIDADGREVEVEVREDEEQKVKLQEIVDLLVAAGYFRARIKGLSSFDKVVGGMTWCIETCNFDVDVDLLFHENLTIGQKIALTEKIVAVLPEMKCPHRIEPHQIQGLDFIHIFPVIQWLVKRSVETREEMGHFVQSFGVSQFNKLCPLVEKQRVMTQQENILRNILTIKEVYRPQRHFRRKDAPPEEEESCVQSTLLEYGYSRTVAVSAAAEPGERGEENGEQIFPEVQETQRLEEGRLTAGVVGNIVSLQAQEIAQAAERYAELQAELEGKGGASPSSHARALAALGKQKAALTEQELRLKKERACLETAIEQESLQLRQVCAVREQVDKELKDMESLETEENQGILQKLQTLVVLDESLKQQDVQFRDQCKLELGKLQKLVKDAQESATPDNDTDNVSIQFEEEQDRVQKLRLLLAKRTRSIATLQRQLDEVPGRAELAQYQRRFLELYNQVAAKHKETKQFYTLYNTLDDKKLYLSKELTLLNSILDNYTEAMSSTSGKEQFMKQFDAIVEGIKQNKVKVEHRHSEEHQRRDKLSHELLGLVEQQRRYVAAVRQLTIECRRNEAMLARLRGT
ncbi:Coiled-coil domain-containing protein 93 [Cryptotermes secundus]|uniref:Coiled-coil domain-containing protein 93 n=1 Tax=Cryptotermes secundus TaxID=105785 RepID=A0A2J7RBS0_9NEOP|nr:coiled-coil domain-containing protein 93 isoform X2 [Cryptotermes secundus]PNF38272.1 Coiled-coil domain-containing protein 93 [Cryptotermes secundus]